ncbi:MAG TPA: hypothetical protein VJ842_21070 [Pyrinomonadaceae bacterium]|nr:hypothetical protein [Pyrinomonadaceae bacterium]
MERVSELSELEAEWARRLAEAEQRAHASGRSDVADYLALRALNDVARGVGIEWLLATFTARAGEANRAGASVELAHADAHRFRVGNSTMVGRRLTLTSGVRVLTVEAGWPRTPRDGIVRGGGLASARISHFGNRRDDDELLLVHDAGDTSAPRWLILDRTGTRPALEEARVSQHVAKLLN